MKQYLLLFVCLFLTFVSYGQISHGGQPLLSTPQLKASLLKDFDSGFFVEMPSFDVNKLLEEDRMNEQEFRGGFRFANKFITTIERGVDGLNYQMADGTGVWQVGIRSEGAYSINVLFGEFDIPEGGKLFIYNSNRTHVIGSFTHENNRSGNNILPTQPVEGDEIIVEYTEPANVPFSGKLKITEVNHDYRDIFTRFAEPEVDINTYPCAPDALCGGLVNKENLRSTVLLIINGTSGCTGTLVNNTKNDKTPYLITAVHCLNSNPAIARDMDYYLEKSGTVVTFFNYQRSICNSMMRGIESQTVAGSTALAVIEKKDVALLRLNELPPDHYYPYYSGWNIEQDGGAAPYTNFHHPNKTVKKWGMFNGNLSLSASPFPIFDDRSHWTIPAWTQGSTDGGSSGSPLFDASGLLIGGLSGGSSACDGKNPNSSADYFFALYKSWEYGLQDSIRLKSWLDPDYEGVTKLTGFDPFKDHPMERLSNADYNAGTPDGLVITPVDAHGSGHFFGHNSLQETNEFAEAFNLKSESELVGAYLMIPPVSEFSGTASPVKINVYTGRNGPEVLVTGVLFNPTYVMYDASKGGFMNNPVTLNGGYGSENFVVFPGGIKVNGKFYVSYEITYPSAFNFSVYNTTFGSKKENTAWVKTISGKWYPSDKYPGQPVTTSLAIQPVIIGGEYRGEEPLSNPDMVAYDRQNKVLYVNAEPEETGIVTIYSVTGRTIRSFPFSGPQFFTVNSGRRGSVGIVRATSNIRNSAIKIIF
ncbi:MAG: lysyl endopeptidase [Dysgonamonadaceae bacterium]|jgi:hypothetical protein|nr:lysyl endopeptidase [Dysgonamonadaceae bacterium]